MHNLDELLHKLEENHRRAGRPVHPWQHAINPGSHIIRLYDDRIIYGTVEQPFGKHLEIINDNANLRLVTSYSVETPTGEMEMIHISAIDGLISPLTFRVVQMMRWPNNMKEFWYILHITGDTFYGKEGKDERS